MPVLLISCPDCGHQYRSLVVEGTRVPPVWVCSRCGGDSAAPEGDTDGSGHPWADACMDGCCG
jgi:transcription elongation factor Elf1